MTATNEFLAVRIQSGENKYIPELWDAIKRLVHVAAYKYYVLNEKACRRAMADVEDLFQYGFLAMASAVKDFKQESGYKFTTFLYRHLLNQFHAATDTRTEAGRSRAAVPVLSLDAPLSQDTEDTLGEFLPDNRAVESFDRVLDSVYSEKVNKDIEPALLRLPEDEYRVITLCFYDGLSFTEVAEKMGIENYKAHSLFSKALRKLRKAEEIKAYKEEYTSILAYMGTGFCMFRDRWESSVERAVIRLEKRFPAS